MQRLRAMRLPDKPQRLPCDSLAAVTAAILQAACRVGCSGLPTPGSTWQLVAGRPAGKVATAAVAMQLGSLVACRPSCTRTSAAYLHFSSSWRCCNRYSSASSNSRTGTVTRLRSYHRASTLTCALAAVSRFLTAMACLLCTLMAAMDAFQRRTQWPAQRHSRAAGTRLAAGDGVVGPQSSSPLIPAA